MKKTAPVILTLLAFAALWQIISMLINKPFLPGPAKTADALCRLAAEGKLWRHLRSSLSRIILAVVSSGVPAMILGSAAGRSKRINSFVSPVVYLLHPLPKAAFLPLIMLCFGTGEASKVFLTGFIIFSQILVTARDAAKQIDERHIEAARSLGAGKTEIIRHVIIPSMLPDFFTGFRVSLGTAVAVLFFAETFASESGLGYLIAHAWTRIAYAEMYAAILALSLLGLALFLLTDLAEFLACPWRRS